VSGQAWFTATLLSLCSPGTYSASGSSVGARCMPCVSAPGSGCSVEVGGTSATGEVCPIGRYSLGGNGSLCEQCPAGRYGNVTGLSSIGCSGACVASASRRCAAGSVSAEGEVVGYHVVLGPNGG
jgi:hypothetical protein